MEITVGDRVYLWTAGANGGVLAVATVIDEPSVRPAEPALRPFMRDPAALDGDQPRVGLYVEHVLRRPILRSDLLAHPVLRNLAVIRIRQGTNFRVTAEQAEALAHLVAPEWEQLVLVCWQGDHVLSMEWVAGIGCPLCGKHLVAVAERHLDVVGAMFTLIGQVSPERLARVRKEARHLLAFEARNASGEQASLT